MKRHDSIERFLESLGCTYVGPPTEEDLARLVRRGFTLRAETGSPTDAPEPAPPPAEKVIKKGGRKRARPHRFRMGGKP